MKRLLLFGILLMSILFFMVACNDATQKNDPKIVYVDTTRQMIDSIAREFNKVQDERWKLASKVFDTLTDKRDFPFLNKWKDTEPIDEPFAKFYIDHFKKMSRENVTDRTEAVWIKKDAIITFMQTLLSNTQLDGIRIYYAKYPMGITVLDRKVDTAYEGRHTLVFVATQKTEIDSVHKDFYRQAPNSAVRSDGLFVYDYNKLCPNQCPGATLGGY